MDEVVSMVIAFIVVYLVYLLLVVFNKKGRKKLKTGIEAKFLKKVYKIDLNKINEMKFANSIAINNSIIIAVTFYLTGLFFENAMFQILIAFPFLILLIILIYSLTGRYYKKHVWFIRIWKRIKQKKHI